MIPEIYLETLQDDIRKFASAAGVNIRGKDSLQILGDWASRDRRQYGRDVMLIAERIGVATDNKDPLTLREDIIRYVQTLLEEREHMLQRAKEMGMLQTQ